MTRIISRYIRDPALSYLINTSYMYWKNRSAASHQRKILWGFALGYFKDAHQWAQQNKECLIPMPFLSHTRVSI